MSKPVKYFNNPKPVKPNVKNRRDADALIQASYKTFMLLGLTALHDEFDFGKIRLKRFMNKMDDLTDSVGKGYINSVDLNETLSKETGIDVFKVKK